MSKRIVAISGQPGGGKSTVSAAVAKRLGGALVEYDAYDTLTHRAAADVAEWLSAGGAYDDVDVVELVRDLSTLRAGGSVLDRRTGSQMQADSLIILETPFGRAHPRMAPLIDVSVFLDTNADLALARKVRELVAGNLSDPGPGGHGGFLKWLEIYLLHYEQVTRPAIAIQRQRVLPLADLVIPVADATVHSIIKQVIRFVDEWLAENATA